MADPNYQLFVDIAESSQRLLAGNDVGNKLLQRFGEYLTYQRSVNKQWLINKLGGSATEEQLIAHDQHLLTKVLNYTKQSSEFSQLNNLMRHDNLPQRRQWYSPQEMSEVYDHIMSLVDKKIIPNPDSDYVWRRTIDTIICTDELPKYVIISFIKGVVHGDQLIFYNPLTMRVRADIEIENDNIRGKALMRESIYQCTDDKCGSKNVNYVSVQTRSADEPTNDYCTCADCGKQFWVQG